MKIIKALGYCTITLLIITVAVLAVSLYTLLMVLSGALAEGTFNVDMGFDEASETFRLTMNGNPRNNGLLGVNLNFQVAIVTMEGEYVAQNSTRVYIAPGEQSTFSVNLIIPAESLEEYNLLEGQGFMEIKFSIGTLEDLVSFTNTMRIGGGGGEE